LFPELFGGERVSSVLIFWWDLKGDGCTGEGTLDPSQTFLEFSAYWSTIGRMEVVTMR